MWKNRIESCESFDINKDIKIFGVPPKIGYDTEDVFRNVLKLLVPYGDNYLAKYCVEVDKPIVDYTKKIG